MNYRAKRECGVVCVYGYGRPFDEFKQIARLDTLWGLQNFTKTENKLARRQMETKNFHS
jgi:hypothetical protein